MFSVSTFYNTNRYDATEAALYASLDKVAWCIGLGWVIFACVTQNGGKMISKLIITRVLKALRRAGFAGGLPGRAPSCDPQKFGLLKIHTSL